MLLFLYCIAMLSGQFGRLGFLLLLLIAEHPSLRGIVLLITACTRPHLKVLNFHLSFVRTRDTSPLRERHFADLAVYHEIRLIQYHRVTSCVTLHIWPYPAADDEDDAQCVRCLESNECSWSVGGTSLNLCVLGNMHMLCPRSMPITCSHPASLLNLAHHVTT